MKFIRIGDIKISAEIATRYDDTAWGGRASKAITVKMDIEEAKLLFHDGVKWFVLTEYTDDLGKVQVNETEMSEYILAGSVTDHRDGRVTAKMGAYKRDELQTIPLSEAVNTYAEAVHLRGVIEKTAQYIDDDAEALAAKNLYPTWEELMLKGYIAEKVGFKFRYAGGLFKTLQADSAFVQHYVPGEGTESLYARIDEVHSGTADDPIPYGGNMALEYGKYYAEGGKVYRCTRDTVNPVYHTLADLVGLYVEVV